MPSRVSPISTPSIRSHFFPLPLSELARSQPCSRERFSISFVPSDCFALDQACDLRRSSRFSNGRRRGGEHWRRGQGLPRQAHHVRALRLHRRRHRRPHLRIRHRHLRWRDVDEPVPDEVLPVGVPQGAGGGAEPEQPVLQVRQPAADHVHVVAVPGGAGGVLLRGHGDARGGAQVVHVRRRRDVPGRRGAQRRRQGRGDAHPGPRPPGHRRRLRQPVGARVPVGDGPRPAARDAQHRLPAHDHHRHPVRQPHQLRHGQDQGRVGVARQPGARGRPRGHHRRGRAVPARHPQLAHRPRPHGRRQADAQARARHGGRGGGVRRPGGRQRGVQAGGTPLAQHPAAEVPPAAGHGRRHPHVPAAHGHQRHHVLRARAVQDAGLRGRRLAHVRRHHRARQRLRHLRLHRHRRPPRPPQAVPAGRRPDARLPGRRRQPHRRQVRLHRRGRDPQGVRGHRGALHLRLRGRLRLVLGAPRLAGAQRDLPAGDPLRGAEHHRLRQHALHLRHRAGFPPHALPLQVHPLLLLRRLGGDHDHLRRVLPAGDQERAHRGDGARLEGALVLGPLHPRRGRARRRRPRDALRRQRQARHVEGPYVAGRRRRRAIIYY